jgi:hypothetical protein
LWVGLSFVVILASRSLDAQQPAGQSAIARSRQAALEIKADVLVDALIDELAGHLVETDRMVERIIEAPGEHRVALVSRKLLLTWAQGEFDGQYEQRLREIHERINQEQPEWAITLGWLQSRPEVLRPGALQGAKSAAMQRFDCVFESARKSAVQQQWIDLDPQVDQYLPGAADIEDIAASRARDWTFVRYRLEDQLASDDDMPWRNGEGRLILFEENTKRINSELQDKIQRGLDELSKQRQKLRYLSVNGALAETLEARLGDQLVKYLQRSRASYGIFPSVQKMISERAEQLMEQRLAEMVDRRSVCEALGFAWLKQLIRSDIEGHADPQKSFDALSRELPEPVRERLIRRHLEREQESPEHAQQLADNLAAKAYLIRALEQNTGSCLKYQLPKVRDAIAGEQAQQHFPNLATKTLTEKTILEYRAAVDEAVAKDHLLALAGIDMASVTGPILDETRDRLAEEAEKLIEEGLSALDAQVRVADGFKTSIDVMRARKMPREDILADLLSKFEREWSRKS